MSKRHLKIVNPVRFFIFILISIMIMVFAGYSLIGAGRAEAAAVTTYKQVVVHEGDSIWGIVDRYNPDSKVSTKQIVREICDANDIDIDDVQPGDMIFVPIY